MSEIKIPIVIIAGKTRSGKDTLAHTLEQDFNYRSIVSYTTRPIRPFDTPDVTHHFVTPEELHEKMDQTENIVLGYTKFDKTGYEYAAIVNLEEERKRYMEAKTPLIYIIDPQGIYWMMSHLQASGLYTKFIFVYVYCHCNESTILERAKANGEDLIATNARLESERDQFDYTHDHWGVLLFHKIYATHAMSLDDYHIVADHIKGCMTKISTSPTHLSIINAPYDDKGSYDMYGKRIVAGNHVRVVHEYADDKIHTITSIIKRRVWNIEFSMIIIDEDYAHPISNHFLIKVEENAKEA